MTVEEIKKLRDLEFTIENTLKGGRIYISVNREFAELFRKALSELEESEGKSMTQNVTVSKKENKILEKYWLMRAIKDGDMYGEPRSTPKRVITEKECTNEPTPQEIAQFLSDSKADFVSVVQNYRFENELPFC